LPAKPCNPQAFYESPYQAKAETAFSDAATLTNNGGEAQAQAMVTALTTMMTTMITMTPTMMTAMAMATAMTT